MRIEKQVYGLRLLGLVVVDDMGALEKGHPQGNSLLSPVIPGTQFADYTNSSEMFRFEPDMSFELGSRGDGGYQVTVTHRIVVNIEYSLLVFGHVLQATVQ